MTAFEAHLSFLVNLKKDTDFPDRTALKALADKPLKHCLCLLEVDVDDADCIDAGSIFKDGIYIGQTTSGRFGHWVKKPMAIAWFDAAHARAGTTMDIELYGEMRKARPKPKDVIRTSNPRTPPPRFLQRPARSCPSASLTATAGGCPTPTMWIGLRGLINGTSRGNASSTTRWVQPVR
ncbi:glycine cleavage T C-terminal barrel domain-containing protein [uncultured Tateyamaria sp.]|uniref:glycine cleavage T C-terminal barrel domain-containing protein n=1 Tax=uncultured Tateyamaria sp. TaxID=455651 RepID=UPI003443592D